MSDPKPMRKALPTPTPTTLPYWEAAKRHELVIQHCLSCDTAIFYPRICCPHCSSSNMEWRKASGRATLYSYVINHLPAPGYELDAPYIIAIVQLEEGPRMLTNLVNTAPDPLALPLDMPLEVDFEDRGHWTIPMFRPAKQL